MRAEGVRVLDHEAECSPHLWESMLEGYQSFWQMVDSQPSPYAFHNGDTWPEVRGLACLASRSDLTRCERTPEPGMPFCDFHIGDALRAFRAYFADEIRKQAQFQLEQARRTRTRHAILSGQDQDAADLLAENQRSVYFFLVPNRAVKIGYSTRLSSRLTALRKGGGTLTPAGLDCSAGYFYAVIGGGRAVEGSLHRSLYSHRICGEWFRLSPTVQAVMDEAKAVADEQARSAA